jgi:hypothetical protein
MMADNQVDSFNLYTQVVVEVNTEIIDLQKKHDNETFIM